MLHNNQQPALKQDHAFKQPRLLFKENRPNDGFYALILAEWKLHSAHLRGAAADAFTIQWQLCNEATSNFIVCLLS